MAHITILTEKELRTLVPLDLEAVACVEQGFRALSLAGVVMPPILRLDIEDHHGEVDVKTAYVPGLDSFAIKISPGFFNNPTIGLPSLNGLMVLFSARTGLAQALLLDNGYLTAVRTAAAGAVAARHLSRSNAETVTVVGAGEQGRLQLEALMLVRPIKRARYWSRRHDQAITAAAELSRRLGIEVSTERDAASAVSGADIIVTCTPATTPILQSDWLEPGQHITAMGSDAEHKNELHPAIFSKADVYVADSLSQVVRLGELHHAIEAGVAEAGAQFPELGDVIVGKNSGRPSDDAITIADLTGTGVQDTAIAVLAWERAERAQAGIKIDSE